MERKCSLPLGDFFPTMTFYGNANPEHCSWGPGHEFLRVSGSDNNVFATPSYVLDAGASNTEYIRHRKGNGDCDLYFHYHGINLFAMEKQGA